MKKIIFFLVLYVVASCAPTTSVMAETGTNIEQAYYEKWVAVCVMEEKESISI